MALTGFCVIGGYFVWSRISIRTRVEVASGARKNPDEDPAAAPDEGGNLDLPDPGGEGRPAKEAPEARMSNAAATRGDGASSPALEADSARSDVDAAALVAESRAVDPAAGASARSNEAVAAAKGSARAKGASPPAKAKQAAPSRKDNLFTLVVEGKLGAMPLSKDDRQTWARLGYFLREEASRRFFLVFPGGSIPLVVPSESAAPAKAKPKASDTKKPPVAPAGDPAFPGYRLVLRAKSQAEGSITFYGQSMASKYRCDIACSIERRSGDSYREIDRVSVSELWTPSTAQKVDGSTAVRKVYDVCLERLVKSLGQRALFTGK